MADEEVDWGVDELNETSAVVPTADEDVLSLGGEADEASPAPAPVAIDKEKKAPTGPKSTEPSVPAENLDENGTPLPAGWTKIVSRTHGKIFYHNTTTKETSWEVPVAAPVAKPEESTKEGSPPKSSPKVEDKENPKPAPGPISGVSPQTARAAPSGPASWRSAQAQESPKVHGQAQVRNRDREADNDRDRDNKRTRMSSPNGQGNGNGSGNGNGNGNRFPSRAEPPRRQRSPPPGPSSLSRGSSYRNDPPREPFNNQGAGPRTHNGPGLPVRQPTGPGLNNHGFGDRDRRRDMDPPSRPARDRSPPRGPRPENQAPAPSSFRPPPGVAGSNRAPIANNRWGAPPSGSSTPSVNGRGSQEPSRSNSGSNSNSVALADRITKPTPAPAVDERARLLEKKRKAQEELDKIKEEEARLEKIESGKKADEERIKRREEERRKEDELAEARRRGLPNPPPRGAGFGPGAGRGDVDRERDRAPFRDDRDRGGSWRRDDDDRRDFDRRRDDDRNYPPRRPEPRDRPSMGPGGKSPFEPSSYRPSHPPSPPPLSVRLRSPPPRRALSPRPRSRSPPPRMGGGDSYRPDRDGPSLPPRDPGRMGGPLRDRDPRPTFAEPMSSYASRGPPRDRPLAERMSLDDRDRRYPPRDERDRDRDRRW